MRSKAGAEGPAESGSKDVTQAEEKEKEQGAKPAKPEDKQAAKPKKKTVVNHSVRVDIEKLDDLMNLVSEMIIAKNAIISAGEELYADKRNSPEARNYKQQMEYMERITSSIHESVMRVRMVPIESVINRFPRMIRDIAKKLDKEIQLIITGEDTELDRTVIDEIGDPLMHMLRNAADHGLEMPDDREKAGKPRLGTIWIEAGQQGDNVLIRVRDDGAGIDVNKVRKKAMEKGQITQEEAAFMTDNDVVQLLFKPSFSTAEKVSDLSGRGVGLDVVKSKIEGLGGDVTVETELGKGSTFIIRLPLTLAIIKALMVYIHDEVYAIPLGLVSTVELMPRTSVNYIQDRPFINLRDEVIPLLFMREYFQLPEQEAEDSRDLVVVIVKKGLKSLGIVVDDFIGQQEVVVKPIGNYINPPKAISGSTILGNGNVALILDANALI
jgi:two-component system chemotaxis sensor kinase CheA